MATPFFQLQTPTLTMRQGQPFSILIPTLDSSGNPVNVSSGYTVQTAKAYASALQNPVGTPVDMSSQGTFTFGATGVTWSATEAQVEAINALLQTTSNLMALTISNDSGSTQSIVGKLNLQTDPVGGVI